MIKIRRLNTSINESNSGNVVTQTVKSFADLSSEVCTATLDSNTQDVHCGNFDVILDD